MCRFHLLDSFLRRFLWSSRHTFLGWKCIETHINKFDWRQNSWVELDNSKHIGLLSYPQRSLLESANTLTRISLCSCQRKCEVGILIHTFWCRFWQTMQAFGDIVLRRLVWKNPHSSFPILLFRWDMPIHRSSLQCLRTNLVWWGKHQHRHLMSWVPRSHPDIKAKSHRSSFLSFDTDRHPCNWRHNFGWVRKCIVVNRVSSFKHMLGFRGLHTNLKGTWWHNSQWTSQHTHQVVCILIHISWCCCPWL